MHYFFNCMLNIQDASILESRAVSKAWWRVVCSAEVFKGTTLFQLSVCLRFWSNTALPREQHRCPNILHWATINVDGTTRMSRTFTQLTQISTNLIFHMTWFGWTLNTQMARGMHHVEPQKFSNGTSSLCFDSMESWSMIDSSDSDETAYWFCVNRLLTQKKGYHKENQAKNSV